MTKFVPHPLLRALLIFAFLNVELSVDLHRQGNHGMTIAATSPAKAAAADAPQDASPWIVDQHSSMRLIAGSRDGNVLLGGIAMQLQPGWKTYWRTPGDSGVPPRFDFSASDNIETVTVLWPTPAKFPDGAGGTSFGYKNQVVFPLRIIAKNPDKPIILRATVDYAVCEKLCLPVETKAEVSFGTTASMEDGILVAALGTVPQPAKIGDANALTIQAVKRTGHDVHVDVVTPDKKETDLFVEGPTPDWALPAPTLKERAADGVQRFSFPLDGVPSGAQPEGAVLKLTLSSGGRAYEFNVTLD